MESPGLRAGFCPGPFATVDLDGARDIRGVCPRPRGRREEVRNQWGKVAEHKAELYLYVLSTLGWDRGDKSQQLRSE